MTCDLCGQRNGTVSIQQLIGNEDRELHLCSECARERGIAAQGGVFDKDLTWLADELLDSRPTNRKQAAVCPDCGLELAVIRSRELAGCPACYVAFRRVIARMLNVNRNEPLHKGRYPVRLAQYGQFFVEREKLKENLKGALAHEDYERAARLRDRILEIETPDGET
jgi:protein arginine kinase activator